MRTDCERAGDGSESRERTAERLQDEEAWSRMDDDGAPTATAQQALKNNRSKGSHGMTYEWPAVGRSTGL